MSIIGKHLCGRETRELERRWCECVIGRMPFSVQFFLLRPETVKLTADPNPMHDEKAKTIDRDANGICRFHVASEDRAQRWGGMDRLNAVASYLPKCPATCGCHRQHHQAASHRQHHALIIADESLCGGSKALAVGAGHIMPSQKGRGALSDDSDRGRITTPPVIFLLRVGVVIGRNRGDAAPLRSTRPRPHGGKMHGALRGNTSPEARPHRWPPPAPAPTSASMIRSAGAVGTRTR
jgi:hypothetical protein